MALLTELSLTTPEDTGSNPAISNFHEEHMLIYRNDENKEKLAKNGPSQNMWGRLLFENNNFQFSRLA